MNKIYILKKHFQLRKNHSFRLSILGVPLLFHCHETKMLMKDMTFWLLLFYNEGPGSTMLIVFYLVIGGERKGNTHIRFGLYFLPQSHAKINIYFGLWWILWIPQDRRYRYIKMVLFAFPNGMDSPTLSSGSNLEITNVEM